MRSAVLSILPSPSRNLLDEIERFAGVEVEFVRREEPATPTIPNPDASATEVHHDRAVISIYRDAITPDGITHELLHIHRYWIEGVPQIMQIGNNPDHWSNTSQI